MQCPRQAEFGDRKPEHGQYLGQNGDVVVAEAGGGVGRE